MGKTLSEFVKDNSKFLKLEDGGVFEGIYVVYKVVPSKFDPEKETVVYKLQYDDGKEIYFQTASIAVANTLGKLKGKERIRIKREGMGNKTSYKITSPDIVLDDEKEEDVEFGSDVFSGDPERNPGFGIHENP